MDCRNPGPRRFPFTNGSALRETWKRTGDGWKLKAVQEVTGRPAIAAH